MVDNIPNQENQNILKDFFENNLSNYDHDFENNSTVVFNNLDDFRPVMSYLQDNDKINTNLTNNLYCKKIVKPTSEEIQLHKNYLKTNLKKNFFS